MIRIVAAAYEDVSELAAELARHEISELVLGESSVVVLGGKMLHQYMQSMAIKRLEKNPDILDEIKWRIENDEIVD